MPFFVCALSRDRDAALHVRAGLHRSGAMVPAHVSRARAVSRLALLLSTLAAGSCGQTPSNTVSSVPSSTAGAVVTTRPPLVREAGEAWFVDRAADAGLLFTHRNGMSGKFYYGEIIAPGAALFDYDNDGDLDV